MLPDRVLNPEPLTYESDALPIALRGPAQTALKFTGYVSSLPLCNQYSKDALLRDDRSSFFKS